MSMKREFDLVNFTESEAKRCKVAPLSFDDVKVIIENDDSTKLLEVINEGLLPDINMKGECLIYPHKEHRGKYSATLLGLALIRESIECVKVLLNSGADTSCKLVACYTSVLECACHSSSVELVKLLIERGITFDDQAIYRSFSHIYPIRGNDDKRDLISTILLPYINDVNYEGYIGRTFLILVCGKGNVTLAGAFLERGAYRDAVDQYGNDAVYYAADEGHLAVVKLLLDWNKSYPIPLNRLNRALIHAAVWSGQLEAARILTEYGANAHTAALLRSLSDNVWFVLSVPMATFLLDHGADVRATDSEGCSVLRRVIKQYNHWSRVTLVTLLLKRGADADEVISETGETLLLHYCRDDAEMVSILLFHGADVNLAHAVTGETPLMRAALMPNVGLVKIFLRFGADVNQTNFAGQTVLDKISAARGGVYAEIAQLCVEHVNSKPVLK